MNNTETDGAIVALHMSITTTRRIQLENLRREARILRAMIELAKQRKKEDRERAS